ncbi:MAG: hypothetical protein L7F78_18700, partial [Syntrophales bacterium LBB04]|nr:hypothetical protein [Syntrophales bacterium LBB04]
MKGLFPALVFLCLLAGAGHAAEEYTFSPSEIEKKPYHVGGYLEFRPILFGLDKNAAFYKLNLFNKDVGDKLLEYNGRLWIDANIQKGIAGFYLQMNTDYRQSDVVDSTSKTKPYQAYLSLKPSSSLTIDTGKKTSKWGKGYAWNPAAFVDRPKDPDDPELALEGYSIVSADYIKSFSSGPLKTFSFTPVLLPAFGNINDDFGVTDHVNAAAKAYFLLYDTDIDLMFLTGGSKTTRYGFDFSRNIGTNLEVHGEFALIEQFKKTLIDANGNTHQSTNDEVNYVLGMRYLTALNTTYIFEYYRQGSGFSSQEMSGYFSFVNKGYDAFLSRGDTRGLAKAATLTQGNYGRFTPERHYLYFRVSHPEPFDFLYFTPALTLIGNVKDRSFSFS